MDASSKPLLISEIYLAVCGEGSEIGLPAVFVRTSGCNMRCAGWPCDTPYASVAPQGEMMTPEEVCQRVLSFRCPRVFITGGEPLLWREQVAKIASELHSRGLWVMIQSNGSIYAPEVFQHCSFVSLDYKTPSSGEESCADVIAQTVQNHRRVQVKFPVADENDLLFAISRSQELAAYGGVELVLQPVNRVGEDSTLDLLAKLKWLQEEVLRRGCFQFRVLPQMHVIVHGGTVRGV